MSWRTVVISSRCKLDLKMGYMVIRGEELRRIFLDEIAIVLIENPSVSMTGCLLSALMERKIKVIFCDLKRSPQAELVPYYGSHDCAKKVKQQLSWSEAIKGAVWSRIVTEKIFRQAIYLQELGFEKESAMLNDYINQIEFQDATNREGHAAKVYFNALFGKDFTRTKDCPVNAALNYGYSVLLSAFNREIVSNGYLTQLGLHHDNMFNRFNLSCDFFEPYRILIDRIVRAEEVTAFDKDTKRRLLNVLNSYVIIDNAKQSVLNAVSIYTRSLLEALRANDLSLIKMYSL